LIAEAASNLENKKIFWDPKSKKQPQEYNRFETDVNTTNT